MREKPFDSISVSSSESDIFTDSELMTDDSENEFPSRNEWKKVAKELIAEARLEKKK